MRKRTAGRKSIPLAVIILAFFHWFSYHYGALSHNVETKKICQTDSRSGGIGMILLFLLPDTALETTV